GYCLVNFDEPSEEVSVYSEFPDQSVKYLDGKIFAPTLCESKIVYNKHTFKNFEAEVEMSTINPKGKFDSGIYFYGSGFNDKIDGCTAWEVNVEHVAGGTTYALKLHRFENNRWTGVRSEVFGLPYTSDVVRLKIVVNNGILKAYVNGSRSLLTYGVGNGSGYVGLRNFYAPVAFDNLKITAEEISLNTSELEKAINQAVSIDESLYTKKTFSALESAVQKASSALQSQYQSEIDRACEQLNAAICGLVKTVSKEEMQKIVSQAKAVVENADKYAKNTVSSMEKVLYFAEIAIQNDDVDEMSYWYGILEHKLSRTISI
ncbi:MAG: hypothetical protein ACI4QL_03810, partial [Candidatus Fimimonas sp.]